MELAVASACLESCVLAKECVILKEYAGLRVKEVCENLKMSPKSFIIFFYFFVGGAESSETSDKSLLVSSGLLLDSNSS